MLGVLQIKRREDEEVRPEGCIWVMTTYIKKKWSFNNENKVC